MATVNQTIIGIITKKNTSVIDGAAAVTGLLAEVKKQILAELITLPNESYMAFNLRQTLRSIEGHLSGWESSAVRLLTGGLDLMWGEGAAIMQDVSRVAGVSAGFGHIPTSQLEVLKDFTTSRISGVTADAMKRIQGEISLGVLGQQTPAQIAAKIVGSITEPSIFESIAQRAETITRTELGRAFSMATDKSIASAAATLPALEKMWIHAGHPRRARLTHVAASGQHVEAAGSFLIGGVIMRHPRDPAAPVKEVIHCGCDEVPWMASWGKRDDFLADWEKQQAKVAKRRDA